MGLMPFFKRKQVAQWSDGSMRPHMTNSTPDPRSIPSEQGGAPIDPDKAQVAPVEKPNKPLLSPAVRRYITRRKNEGPQLDIDTRPGVMDNLPFTNTGERIASDYDRNYSPMCDTQTSPGNNQDLVPIGQSSLTGVNSGAPKGQEGPPIRLKKKKKAGLQRSRPSTVVPWSVPGDTGQLSNIQKADSVTVLPRYRNLLPAYQTTRGTVLWGPQYKTHAQVLSDFAGVSGIDEEHNPELFEKLVDDALGHIRSEGFYDPRGGKYFVREARTHHLKDGVGQELEPEDVDPDQLEAGIGIEMEHTDDPDIAEEIAIDHCSEFSSYYLPWLKDMEEAMKEEGVEGAKHKKRNEKKNG